MAEPTPDEKAGLRKAAERSDIERDAQLLRLVLSDAIIRDHIHPSGAGAAINYLEATALALLDENARLSEEVERLKAERQWIPVGERGADAA